MHNFNLKIADIQNISEWWKETLQTLSKIAEPHTFVARVKVSYK